MRDHPRETQAFLAGFITGSAAHSIADWLVTGGKRYLRRLGFRVTVDYSGHDGWQPRYRRARSRGSRLIPAHVSKHASSTKSKLNH